MKKLLILMLVLGLASIANAVPVSVVILDIEAAAPQDITVDVLGSIDIIVVGPAADWQGYLDVYPGECFIDVALPVILEAAGDLSLVTDYSEYSLPDYYEYELIANTSAAPAPGAEQVAGDHFSTVINCHLVFSQIGAVIELRGYDDPYPLIDKITLHCVPEPATMALLGLGSLFLLRRRK